MIPAFDRNFVIDKLINQYKKHDNLIIAVDFDDTLFNYAKIDGADYTPILDLLKRAKNLNCKIIVYTCSVEVRYEFIRNYLLDKDLEIDGVNKQVKNGTDYGPGAKLFYNIFLDDKSGLKESYEILLSVIEKLEEEDKQVYQEHINRLGLH